MNPGDKSKTDPRRALPAADRLARALRGAEGDLPGWAATEAARRVLARARGALGPSGKAPSEDALREEALDEARRLAAPRPAPVVNATGVVLHTNLGRAPLAPGAARAAAAAAGYADLEIDRTSGRRGERGAAVAEKLVLLSGAEAAFAVNNNAAALVLALDTLARGREVVVSRGELVEIGGSFRLPEIAARAGVRLVEVGTTNRTHAADYESAIGPDTALLLKVHRSNFAQRGFVAEVPLAELAALGRARGLPVVEDLGSATLVDLTPAGFPPESDARTSLRRGADLVLFSGDKLLGGPQAGLVLGRRDPVDAMRRNPLARALRLDKLGLAALDWTLAALLDGREREIPVLRQLLTPAPALEPLARRLAERLAKVAGDRLAVSVAAERAAVGGGSLPETTLETRVVALSGAAADALAASLRAHEVPVVARVREGRVLIDVRTLLPGDELHIEAALARSLARASR